MSDEILELLDLSDFEVCVECIKGKQTNMKKLSAERAKDVLELAHTDICGPFPTRSWNEQQYFISFIDGYSRYGYLYLIHEKSQSLDFLRVSRLKLKFNLERKLRLSNLTVRVSTIANTMDQENNIQDIFHFLLKECGIVSQYTMPSKPSMYGVAE